MAKYAVQFALPSGRMGTETIEAASERAAAARLESEGRTPITVRPVAAAPAGGSAAGRTPRLRGGKAMRRAVLDFTYQMAAVMESGIPVIAGLKAVGDQTELPRLRAAVARIAGRIEGGRALAEALENESDIF